MDGGINPYVYAGDNPVNYSDPFGLQCTDADSPGGREILEGEVCEVAGVSTRGNTSGWASNPSSRGGPG